MIVPCLAKVRRFVDPFHLVFLLNIASVVHVGPFGVDLFIFFEVVLLNLLSASVGLESEHEDVHVALIILRLLTCPSLQSWAPRIRKVLLVVDLVVRSGLGTGSVPWRQSAEELGAVSSFQRFDSAAIALLQQVTEVAV